MKYNHKKIDKKWQEKWAKDSIYEPNLGRAKNPFYNLMMFPYPSAEGLHVGNMYAFTGSDIYGRYKRMNGFDVFEPIGLDGFGIHSENYALKIGIHPVDLAKKSEKNFYRQLRMIGNGFSFKERLETYNPEYYKWTQWLFIQMFKNGLAYRKKAAVNWCPKCLTVLADEQIINGNCERCDTEVIKKELEQWFFRITNYTEKLLSNLETIDWSEKIKIAQRNWIGKSRGVEIGFALPGFSKSIIIFTTRPDTLFGVTYLVLSPEHSMVPELADKARNPSEVKNYIKEAQSKSSEKRIKDGNAKTGVEIKGVKAINPANNEKIPIFVADYILASYGTGAIMAVPAHDERDFEFATKFNLPIKQVIAPFFEDEHSKRRDDYPSLERKTAYCILRNKKTDEYMVLDWGSFGWHTFIIGGVEGNENIVDAALREIREETGYKNIHFVESLGKLYAAYFAAHKKENRIANAEGLLFDLIDNERKEISDEEKKKHSIQWLKKNAVEKFINLSSQKYIWNQFLEKSAFSGQGLLVDSSQFSEMKSEEARDAITNFVGGKITIRYRLRDWLLSRQRYWGPPIPMIHCEKCARLSGNTDGGWHPVPEKDLPVLLPYIENFRPTGEDQSPLAKESSFYKVKCPKCGSDAKRETDVLDTFLDSSWYFFRYLDKDNKKEPFDNIKVRKWLPVHMYIGGAEHAVLHLLYTRFMTMALHDFGLIDFEEPFMTFRAHGMIIKDSAKMSKSRGNVVNPDEYINKYGADVLRMYLMFLGPFEQGGDFTDEGIAGIVRFLEKVWKNFSAKKELIDKNSDSKKNLLKLHGTINKVTRDIENLHYNTAISALMELLNELLKDWNSVSNETKETFLRLLAPFAPHMTEEIWRGILSHKESIHGEGNWPKFKKSYLESSAYELIIQINGKLRDVLEVKRGIEEKEAVEIALSQEKVKKYLGNEASKKNKKVIFIKDRLINFII